MTHESISKGFNNLKPSTEYDNLFYSAKSRQEADWLVGINLTRAFTVKYNTMLSIGRVQTPTLALIVNRQNDIQNFKAEKYYELQAQFDGYIGKFVNDSVKIENDPRINNESFVEKLIEKLSNESGIVKDIQVEENKTNVNTNKEICI